MAVPIKAENIDLVAAHLAAAMLRQSSPPLGTTADRIKAAVDTYHQIRDALVQSEADRGHRL